jgi:DNA polymerase-3 subunit beta
MRFAPIAEKIIPRNSTLPILTNICVDKGIMRATDLETSALMKIEDERSYLLPIGIIKTILKSKPKNIEIELLPDNKIQINYQNRGVIFPALEVQDYPELMNHKFKDIGIWTKQVLQELYHQLLYCSTDELRPALTGVLVRQNSTLLTCATDGHVLRLIRDVDPEKKCKLSKKKFEGVLSNKCVQILARFAINSAKVSITNDLIRFDMNDGLEICSRLIEGQYPKFENVLPEQFSGTIQFDREMMLNLANDAKPFANRYTHLSEVKVNTDHLTLTVEDIENDTTWRSNMPFNSKTGKDILLGLDLDLLQKVLKSIDEKEIVWSYTTPTSASTFTSANGNPLKITNLLMPVRLKEKEEISDG